MQDPYLTINKDGDNIRIYSDSQYVGYSIFGDVFTVWSSGTVMVFRNDLFMERFDGQFALCPNSTAAVVTSGTIMVFTKQSLDKYWEYKAQVDRMICDHLHIPPGDRENVELRDVAIGVEGCASLRDRFAGDLVTAVGKEGHIALRGTSRALATISDVKYPIANVNLCEELDKDIIKE